MSQVCPVLLLLLAVSGAASSQEIPAAPGRMVAVGGHLLHVNCSGAGAPVVVIESGLGDFSTDWTLVQSGVGAFTRVCTYDRAGYAWSEPGPKPRTFAQINLELKEGLKALGERGPFVLVGHSYGGPVVRAFAAAYPKDVAGMVLVDGVHEDQRVTIMGKAVRLRDGAKGIPIPPPRRAVGAEGKSTTRMPPALGPVRPPLDRLPGDAQRANLWASAQQALNDAENSQREWSTEYFALWHEHPQKGLLGGKPLVVLTRAKGGYEDLDIPAEQIERERLDSQRALLGLSTNSRQVLLDSGHNMHLEVPDEVVAAIRSVVDAVRKGGTVVK